MKEKRQDRRIKKRIKSEIHSLEGMTFSPSEDMSNGGIFISTPEPLMIGSELDLSLYVPERENPINIKGVVRWIRDDDAKGEKSGMGIEFISSFIDMI
ncbi:MAG: PilZ domain-containing protein [Spirochaetota bacterium]|nr:PilZ domain-containing protein [Spirochaetota bacterium]